MSETTKNEAMTRFLMYKIAVRCEETELAAECLQVISSATTKDPTLLYACCLDAQQVGNKPQVLATLQLVLEKYNYTSLSAVHLPSLLRLTIQLMLGILEEPQKGRSLDEVEVTVEKLCKTFEAGEFNVLQIVLPADCSSAVTAIKKPHALGSESLWTVPELDWFSKNSYNTAIKNLSTWNPRQTLRMLKCCIAFINHYPSDISEQISEDLCLRKMFCEFSATTALVALARGEDNIEVQMQDYLVLRKHVDSFDNLLQGKQDKMPEGAQQDLLHKLSLLMAFDFEAVCQLKNWDALPEIIGKAEISRSSRVYEIMADCLLCSQAPTQGLSFSAFFLHSTLPEFLKASRLMCWG